MTEISVYFIGFYLAILGALVYVAILDAPPEGERLRVWAPSLVLALLVVDLVLVGLRLALGPARFDLLLLGLLAVGSRGRSIHAGLSTSVDCVTVFVLATVLIFPVLLRQKARGVRRRRDRAISAAISRWGRDANSQSK